MNISNYKNFCEFIINNKNKFEKRKYFLIDEQYEIQKKEPSFIIELAYIYYKTKNKNINELITNELDKTYKEKNKKIERLSKIEYTKLIDSFRRAIINCDKVHSVKLGKELLFRNKNKFFEIMYNLSLISFDCNKLIKTFFMEQILDEIEEKNYNKNVEILDEIIKNIINYFIKSENKYINFKNIEDINYFKNNEIDNLYKFIYENYFDKLVEKYNITTKKINIDKINLIKMNESKNVLYEYLTNLI